MEVNFEPNITLDGIIQIIGFFIAFVGIWIAIRQMNQTSKVNRTKFIYDLTNDLFHDDKLREFFYKIDYEKFNFDANDEKSLEKFKGSDEERWLDALLYRYDLIGKMVRTKVIDMDEVEYILFEVIQVFKNKDVQKYLSWLDNEYDRHGSLGASKREIPHADFRWLAGEIAKTS